MKCSELLRFKNWLIANRYKNKTYEKEDLEKHDIVKLQLSELQYFLLYFIWGHVTCGICSKKLGYILIGSERKRGELHFEIIVNQLSDFFSSDILH